MRPVCAGTVPILDEIAAREMGLLLPEQTAARLAISWRRLATR